MDYKKLGFKCGLEIHQQIEGRKLFCHCPTRIIDGKPDYEFTRCLRVSASELGKIDQAALYEQQKDKFFIYQAYHESNCLVDMDEEPPKDLSKQSLDIALQTSLLFHAKIVDEIQFMRKVVIDGSNVSSFQRTALIATDGYIETSQGRVTIESICLEEESAKKVEDTEKYKKFNISRLGIPLIEVATGPNIKSPEHAKESAEIIGMTLRSIEGVKRGLGSIRQDVNVSIKGGARVEIKGFQDLKSIPKVITYEIERQTKQINKKEKVESHVRKAEKNFTSTYLRPMPGASRMYPETDIPTITITKEMIKATKVPETLAEQTTRFEQLYSLQPDLARQIIKQNIDFEKFTQFKSLPNTFIAKVLIETPKEIKTRFDLDINKLKEEDFLEILGLINEDKIPSDSALSALTEIIKKGKINLDNYKGVSDQELRMSLKLIVDNNRGAPFNALMGEAMKKFRGKVDGKRIMRTLKQLQ